MASWFSNLRDIRAYNRKAWNVAVQRKSQWTVPVDPGTIRAARAGNWSILLTPTRTVPRQWFPDELDGCSVLCLASGGGQQGPVLAAAGAEVTVLDNSPAQLAQDRAVAKREGLELCLVEGDMADLSPFSDGAFDLIVHPCSNMFVPDVRPVWQEAFRVLRAGGEIMAGFWNPVSFIFDQKLADEGVLTVRHRLPYSDLRSITQAELQFYLDDAQPLEFGHTLEDQIGGQLAVGFVLIAMFEDTWEGLALADYMPMFIATRSQKPA